MSLETKNIGIRIKNLRKEHRLSQVELSTDIGLSQSILSQIENGQVTVSVDVVTRISEKFNVRSEWLIYGSHKYVKMLQENEYIPMFDADAVAGYIKNPDDPELLQKLKHFKIPGFGKGDYRIFQVEGESMIPTLSANDQIVCSRVSDIDVIADGALCVVVTDDDVLVKRLYVSKGKERGNLVLKSDNGDFKVYELAREEIREVWQVEAKITRSFIDSSFAHINRVDNLEKDLSEMKGQMLSVLEELKRMKENGAGS